MKQVSKSVLLLFLKKEVLRFLPAIVLVVFCLVGPSLWTTDPFALDPSSVLLPPTLLHPLGTDTLGRDELARLMQGGATTLGVAAVAALIGFVAGLAYGFAAGLGPEWLDRLLMRLLDAVLALPSLVVLIGFAALLPPGDAMLALLIGMVAWPQLARLVRNEVAALRRREFVLAARHLGARPFYLARMHLLPVIGRILAVNAILLLGDAILSLSALSFLGLAIQPPRTSWGHLLAEGMGLIALRVWWLILPPGLLIAASLLAADLAGEVFRPREHQA